MSIEQRFWSKVNRQDEDSCWQWVGAGAHTKHGYGRIRVDGKMRQITHIAWELAYATPVPAGMVIRQSCDNHLCVNFHHLRAGTRSDSVTHAIAMGRLKPKPQEGRKFSDEFNPAKKLTQEEVDEIRSRYKDGNIFQRELALVYGVTRANISSIIRGKTW